MREKDAGATEQYIRNVLPDFYEMQNANGWIDRSVIGGAGLNIAIAAHECVLAEICIQRKLRDFHKRSTT